MMIGPLISTSPVSPGGELGRRRRPTMRDARPPAPGAPPTSAWSSASSPVITVADRRRLGQPVGVGGASRTFGNVSRTIRCSSSADGEPPKATDVHRRRVVVVAVRATRTPATPSSAPSPTPCTRSSWMRPQRLLGLEPALGHDQLQPAQHARPPGSSGSPTRGTAAR